MKTLLILSGVCLGNGVDAYPEEVHEVDDGLALSLLHRGKAVEADKALKTSGGEKTLEDMRATELIEFGKSHGIDLGMKPQDGKAKILAALEPELKARGLA